MNKKDSDIMSGKTDERKSLDWKSRYPKEAIVKQRWEALYILFMILLSFAILFLNFIGLLKIWLNLLDEKEPYFSRIITCAASGLLGGAIFDLKWFYKSIAHAYWNADRVYWRLFTPLISLSFAFCLACIFSDNIVVHGNGFSASTLGFLAGYFSDEAVGKMAEVAKVLFNTNSKAAEEIHPSEKNEEN